MSTTTKNDDDHLDPEILAAMSLWDVTEEQFVEEGVRNEAAGVARLTAEQHTRVTATVLEMSGKPSDVKAERYAEMLKELGRTDTTIPDLMRAELSLMVLELTRQKTVINRYKAEAAEHRKSGRERAEQERDKNRREWLETKVHWGPWVH
jgi:hypothetical protein